uniref:Uncharacterized protein n=1 Tax=Arion vulgaris TaxID=1028688 RepID=A0A0B7BRJ2_9EUPU
MVCRKRTNLRPLLKPHLSLSDKGLSLSDKGRSRGMQTTCVGGEDSSRQLEGVVEEGTRRRRSSFC